MSRGKLNFDASDCNSPDPDLDAEALLLSSVVFAGCSTLNPTKTPDFYPNDTLVQTGKARADAAAQYCMSLADEYVHQPNKYEDALKQGTVGAVVGTATGAVGGVIMGNNVGRSVGAGAAIGGILGVLKSAYESSGHSPSYERFVEHCLSKKGYEVTGWSAK